MKLTFVLSGAVLYSVASAYTHYHTQYHTITVDSNGNRVGGAVPSSQIVPGSGSGNPDTNTDVAQTTVVVGAETTTAATSAATPAVNSDTGSGNSGNNNLQVQNKNLAAASKSSETTSSVESSQTTSSLGSGSGDDIYAQIQSSGADASFAKEILDAHNAKRALHSAGKLSWDSEVYKYAQNYADKFVCESGLSNLVHSGGKYGECLAQGYNTGTAAVEGWYDEVKGYDYASHDYNHFTQVVWKATTKLGCAYKDCSAGKYVICSYDPAGNMAGEFPQNVSPN